MHPLLFWECGRVAFNAILIGIVSGFHFEKFLFKAEFVTANVAVSLYFLTANMIYLLVYAGEFIVTTMDPDQRHLMFIRYAIWSAVTVAGAGTVAHLMLYLAYGPFLGL